MSSSTLLNKLLAHELWGNLRVLEAMRRCEPLPERASTLIAHMVASQHVWISRIKGVPFTMAVFPALSLDQCEHLFNEHHHQLVLWASDDQKLQEVVSYTTTTGVAYQNSVESLLSHICLHSQYHRGQINQLIRPQVTTPDVDYIHYLRSI